MTQRIQEQIGILATIEPKGHFFAIGLEMLRADSMPRTNDAALKERECRLNGVCVNVTLGVDFQLVPNGFVPPILAKVLCSSPVWIVVVGKQHFYILAKVFSNVLFKRPALGIFGM